MPRKAWRAPRCSQPEFSAACSSLTSARMRSLDSWFCVSRSRRVCTARSAVRRVTQRSNSAASSCTRSSRWRTRAPLLPRRPRSSSSCSEFWRRWSRRRALTCARSASTPCTSACVSTCWRAGSSSLVSAASSAGRRLLARSASLLFRRACSAVRADTGNTRSRGICSVCAVTSHCFCTSASFCSSVSSGSASMSTLLSTTKQAIDWPPRCSFQTDRSDLVTPASAPSRNSAACAPGSRPSVSSGSVPIAFRPGVSSTTSPRASSGCG